VTAIHPSTTYGPSIATRFAGTFGFSVQSLGVALLGAGLLSGTAFAADLPLKALPPLPPAFSWTGFYVGAHAGYGWSDADVTLASVATPPSQFTGIFADASANATPSILNTHPGGFIGGGWGLT
jgi:opacity protein-like surface antigen